MSKAIKSVSLSILSLFVFIGWGREDRLDEFRDRVSVEYIINNNIILNSSLVFSIKREINE